MDTPKLLPWMARRAAVPESLARSLWRRAAAEAATLTGQSAGDAFSREALRRLETLLEAESVLPAPFARRPSTQWAWASQRRVAAQTATLWAALSRWRWPLAA